MSDSFFPDVLCVPINAQNKQREVPGRCCRYMSVKGKSGTFPAVWDSLSGVKTGCEWSSRLTTPRCFSEFGTLGMKSDKADATG